MQTVALHGPRLGVGRLCRALAVPRATYYRHLDAKAPPPRPTPTRALTVDERQAVLGVLHEPRFSTPRDRRGACRRQQNGRSQTASASRIRIGRRGGKVAADDRILSATRQNKPICFSRSTGKHSSMTITLAVCRHSRHNPAYQGPRGSFLGTAKFPRHRRFSATSVSSAALHANRCEACCKRSRVEINSMAGNISCAIRRSFRSSLTSGSPNTPASAIQEASVSLIRPAAVTKASTKASVSSARVSRYPPSRSAAAEVDSLVLWPSSSGGVHRYIASRLTCGVSNMWSSRPRTIATSRPVARRLSVQQASMTT